MKISKFILIAGLLINGFLSPSIAVAADDCLSTLQVTFPGGEKGCLTDLPISKKTSKAWKRNIGDVAKFASAYVIVSGGFCDAEEIFTSQSSPLQIQRMNEQVNAYVRNCPSNCNCAKVVDNGTVLISKNLALALGSISYASNETSKVSESPTVASQKVEKEADKPLQPQTSSVAQQAPVAVAPVQMPADPNRLKESELLAQISAELARLRAENDAVKEERKALTQSIVSANIQKPVTVIANRKALVIGNDSYKFVSPLLNAREDAKTMALELGNVGYHVTLKLDLTEKELKSTLRTFKNQIEAGDEVAIFYAGHGVQLDNSNFLLPVDVAGDGEDQVRDEAIALQRILDDVASKKAKFTLAMIDACRDNPFKGSGRSIGGGTRGLAPTTAATGQMVIFSAGSGQQALDKLGPSDKSKNGLFTRVFAREIKTPGVSVDRLVRNVRNEVVNLAKSVGHEQVPAIYDQVVGEFYFKK